MTGPNWQHPDAAAVAPQLQRLDDFFEGTDAVRARGPAYVPQLTKESDANFQMRSTGVAGPGALTRTVEGSVGRIFAIAPTLTPNGLPSIAADWENIDGMGTHGDVFVSKVATYSVLDGFSAIFVDAPIAPGPVVPLPDAPNYRARWIMYRRRDVLNWQTAVEGGQVVLTLLCLAESAMVPEGEWATARESRVRVLRRENGTLTAEVWAERDVNKKKTWIMIEGPYTYDGPTGIPFEVCASGKLIRPFVVRPPLLPLCDKQIETYQVAVDMRHYERMTCFPQPVVKGQIETSPDGQVHFGPTSVVVVSEGGDFKIAEITGTSIKELRENQRERKQEIGMLGLSFLVAETRSAETARAKALDASAENATIADAARGIEDGVNMALVHHAAYSRVPADQAPVISLNKNLSGEIIDAAMARVLLEMRRDGELTRAEYRQILARGKVIPSEMAADAEIEKAELTLALGGIDVGDDVEDAA